MNNYFVWIFLLVCVIEAATVIGISYIVNIDFYSSLIYLFLWHISNCVSFLVLEK